MKVFFSHSTLSSLDVSRMSLEALERELAHCVDLPSLKSEFRWKACTATTAPTVLIALGGTGKTMMASLLARSRPATTCWFFLDIDGDTPVQRRRSLHERLDEIEEGFSATVRSDPRFDAVWPYTDALQRLGVRVAGERDLHRDYTHRFLKILRDASPGLGRYALTWAACGLFDEGRLPAQLARRIASAIADHAPPIEACIGLAVYADTRPDLRKHLPRIDRNQLPSTARAAWVSFHREAAGAAEEACVVLNANNPFRASSVPKLTTLMSEMHDAVPLYGMLGMASTRAALQSIGTVMQRGVREGRERIVGEMCDLLFLNAGQNGRSWYLAFEALAGLRTKMPYECAKALARFVPSERKTVFDETFWIEAMPRLILTTQARLRRFRWKVRAKTPDDYVQEAAMKILTGRCTYDSEHEAPLEFVKDVIEGLIASDAACRENAVVYDRINRAAPPSDPDIEELCVARDLAERFKAWIEPRCREYVDAILDDPDGTLRDHAEAMHVSVREARNVERMVRRRRAFWDRISAPPRSPHADSRTARAPAAPRE